MCRVMRHHRQQAAGMALILDAATHHEDVCAYSMIELPEPDRSSSDDEQAGVG